MLVSIIIPTHNRSRQLRIAIESVLAQTYRPIELIVVDDGSTDDTVEVVNNYKERVMYLHQGNGGVSVARNRGLRASRGEIVGFLDDDDLFLPEKIERQVAYLCAHQNVSLVYCRYYLIDASGKRLGRIGPLPEADILKELLHGNFLWAGAPLIRRDCLEQAGGFNTSLSTAADYELWLRIARMGFQFGCVQALLGSYRLQRNSMVTNVYLIEREIVSILDKLFADEALLPSYRALQNRALASWRFWLSRRYYAGRDWDNASRNLNETLLLKPELLNHPLEFVKEICSDALDERISDPFQYVEDVFTHLPPNAKALCAYRDTTHMQVRLGLALRMYIGENPADARDDLSAVINLYPTIIAHPEIFAHWASKLALQSPVNSFDYIRSVFINLPGEAYPLAALQARITSDVNIGCAFEEYFAGHYIRTVSNILHALPYRPSWIKNRGVMAIMAKSLLNGVTRPIRERIKW
jgi:glycosyltransferase involved in cell wall biosynthesis